MSVPKLRLLLTFRGQEVWLTGLTEVKRQMLVQEAGYRCVSHKAGVTSWAQERPDSGGREARSVEGGGS